MTKKKLTPKQELFIREYLVDLNATQAAIRAGYAERGARTRGAELLANRNIASRIQEQMDKRKTKIELNAEMVLKRLSEIAFTDINEFMENEYYENDEGEKVFYGRKIKENLFDNEKICAVAGLEPGAYGTKLKMKDQLKALEMLSRHLGLFNADETQKPEINQFDFTNISSDKLRKIKKILSED